MRSTTFYTSQGGCLMRLMLLCIAVIVGAWLLPGVEADSFWAVLLTAITISVLNNLLRPILIVVTMPVMVISLGLFIFIIDAVVIVMASAIVDGFHVQNFGYALLFSLVLLAVDYLLELPNRLMNRQTFADHADEEFTPYEEINDQTDNNQ